MIRKLAITAAAVFGFVVLGSSVPAKAMDSCDRRISKAEDNLHKDIRKHGEYSSQANYRRRQLALAREQCGRERYRETGQGRHHHWRDWDRDRDRRDHDDRDHDRREHDKDRRKHDHDKDRDKDHDKDHDRR